MGVVAESDEDADGAVSGRTGLEWQLDALLDGPPRRVRRRARLDGPRPPVRGLLRDPAARGRRGPPDDRRGDQPLLPRGARAERQAAPVRAVVGGRPLREDRRGPRGRLVSRPRRRTAPDSTRRTSRSRRSATPTSRARRSSPSSSAGASRRATSAATSSSTAAAPSGIEMFFNRVGDRYSVNPEPLTPAQILWRSSNVGATRIGLERLKLPGLFEAFRAFRIADRPKSGLPNEAAGLLHAAARRIPTAGSSGATESGAGVSFPRGYEVRVSPLGLALAYTTFATGGWRLEPTVIKEVRVGGRTHHAAAAPRGRTCSRRTPATTCARPCSRRTRTRAAPRTRARARRVTRRWGRPAPRNTRTSTSRAASNTTRGSSGWRPPRTPSIRRRRATPRSSSVVVHHRVAHRGKGTYTGGVVSGPVVRRSSSARSSISEWSPISPGLRRGGGGADDPAGSGSTLARLVNWFTEY